MAVVAFFAIFCQIFCLSTVHSRDKLPFQWTVTRPGYSSKVAPIAIVREQGLGLGDNNSNASNPSNELRVALQGLIAQCDEYFGWEAQCALIEPSKALRDAIEHARAVLSIERCPVCGFQLQRWNCGAVGVAKQDLGRWMCYCPPKLRLPFVSNEALVKKAANRQPINPKP